MLVVINDELYFALNIINYDQNGSIFMCDLFCFKTYKFLENTIVYKREIINELV